MSSQILLLPGDGIGPEVVREARRVLDVVDDQFSLGLSFCEGRLGGIAVDEEGAAYPDATRALARDCLLYTSPSPRDATLSRMPSSA